MRFYFHPQADNEFHQAVRYYENCQSASSPWVLEKQNISRTHGLHKQGIGTALVRKVIEWAEANGCSTITADVNQKDPGGKDAHRSGYGQLSQRADD